MDGAPPWDRRAQRPRAEQRRPGAPGGPKARREKHNALGRNGEWDDQ